MTLAIAFVLLSAVPLELYAPHEAVASSAAGPKYTASHAIDGNIETRWACADNAAMPQWLELRFAEPVQVDTLRLGIAVHDLYSPLKEAEITFSNGDPMHLALFEDNQNPVVRFDGRRVEWIRITVTAVYEQRHYVGVDDVLVAFDPDRKLMNASGTGPAAEITVRGRDMHPCVNVTQKDVADAKARVEKHDWARNERDRIVAEADKWLRESDEYWLRFLPEPGACYAYGFTGCPICTARTGTWGGANCSWDNPGHVICANGHALPNEQCPDEGEGFVAADGRTHYLVGQWNAWVTEQWTCNALPALSRAYLLTGDERYAERGLLLLDALASIYSESTSGSWDYPSNPPSGRFARPWYQVARTLVLYVDHYDFMYNSPAADAPSLREGMTRRENIEKHMLLDGAAYCYGHSWAGALHNGHADYLRGALAVGCLLDIPEYIDAAVNGPFSIHAMLANNIDRDGRYYETALGYAIHARLLYLTFADPLANLRNAEYPQGINLYDDPKFASCLLLPELQVEMYGRMPNFGDSGPQATHIQPKPRPFSDVDYGFLERLCARASDGPARRGYEQALAWLTGGDVNGYRAKSRYGEWLLWHAAEPPAAAAGLPDALATRTQRSWVAGMKGMAMLRGPHQGALLRFGPSLNHGDPDDLGLLYYANGYQPSYDIGYGLGSTHVHCGWASSTVSHCLVTVNETNQLAADGSGGSVLLFADTPRLQLVEATSENSYASEGVTEYRRTVAVVDDAYLLDIFRVAGGSKHDFGFGSIGTKLQPFGVENLQPQEGSLAEGVEWGRNIGADGDINGFPDKPYWNPPPGNGYGFFYNVRSGAPAETWGGTWTLDGGVPTKLTAHYCGDAGTAVYADAPGLYPHYPESSYILARREGEDLRSTFIAVYEPWQTQGRDFAMDRHAVEVSIQACDAETVQIDSLDALVFKGVKQGDAMTVRVDVPEGAQPPFQVYFMTANSYGEVQVEWDGTALGEPVNLYSPQIAGPVAHEFAEAGLTPGEHMLTLRAAGAERFYFGTVGIAFGEHSAQEPARALTEVKRIGPAAVLVQRTDGITDILLSGPQQVDSPFGSIDFDGDFAWITADAAGTITGGNVVGCTRLTIGGRVLDEGPAAFEAAVVSADPATREVVLDAPVPEGLDNLLAVFSGDGYSRTTGYHIARSGGEHLVLDASTLSLGTGRVSEIHGADRMTSDIPHEYARKVKGGGTRFFDGKRIVGTSGAETCLRAVIPGAPMDLSVNNATAFTPGERFDIIDISPGDTVHITLARDLKAE